MARPTRVNVEDGWYHVTCRGIERREIFREDREREHFLGLLETAVERFRIIVHAYVLMDNHYHLIVQTPDANLSAAIQWVNVSYSVWFNRRSGRVGPLFQGRFKSVPVQDSAWAYELSLYVHLNPVMSRSFGLGKQEKQAEGAGYKKPDAEEVKSRLASIQAYRWSSYGAYAGFRNAPSWLETVVILSRARGESEGRQREYRKVIRARLSGGWPDDFQESLREQVAIGASDFVRRVRELARPGREGAGKRRYRARLTLDRVIGIVEQIRGVAYDDFMGRKGDWGRPLLLWSLRNYAGMTLREIGDAVGGVDYAAVQMMISRFEKRALKDKALSGRIEEAKKAMLYVET